MRRAPQVNPLSNHDMDEIWESQPLRINHIARYLGTYSKDTIHKAVIPDIPKRFNCTSFLIVNLQNSDEPGSHWVALYTTPKRHIVFGSYGGNPLDEVLKLIAKYPRPQDPIFSDMPIQAMGSAYCGYYIWYVLEGLIRGESIIDILYDFSMTDKNANDWKIWNWMR